MKIKLNKSSVDAIKNPAAGQSLYYDIALTGFGLRVTPSVKTFFAESRVSGKTVRTKIGRYGVFTVDQARTDAQQLLAKMARGENTNDAKKPQGSEVTLASVLDDYLKQRQGGQGRQIKQRTADGYRWNVNTPLAEWLNLPIASITEAKVREKHKALTMESGPYTANGSMRVLCHLFNFAKWAYPGVGENPTLALSKLGLWNNETRRKRHVSSSQMALWMDAVESLDDLRFPSANRIRGALYVMMFLGFRLTETLTIKVLDFCDGVLELPDTKNKIVHRVPLGPWLADIVGALRADAVKEKKKYLFWSDESKSGHLVNMRKPMVTITETAGIPFSPHDLRRSFVSMLDSMEPAPSSYVIKRLMNHTAKPSDVTAGYIQMEEKRLLSTVTRLEEWILLSANRSPTGQRLSLLAPQTT